MKTKVLLSAAAFFISSWGWIGCAPAALQTESRDALAIHRQAVVVDTHTDTLMRVLDPLTWQPKINIIQPTGFQMDIPQLQEGGVGVPFFGAFTIPYQDATKHTDYARTNSRLLALMNALHWTVNQNPDSIGLVRDYADIGELRRAGKIAAVLSIEGAYSLREPTALELLRQYRDLGVRAVALAWNTSNALAAGTSNRYADETPSAGGLTPLGRDVVQEMNRLGLIIDVSHMNPDSFWDTVTLSTAPVIASHSAVMTLRPHVRNLTDDQIKAIAKGRGVVQLALWGEILTSDGDRTVRKFVDHVDYIVKLVGVDYVGIGSDFDGAETLTDLPNCAAMPAITRELVARGYATADIQKILGGNTLRVMQEVWRKAEQPGKETGPVIVPSLAMGATVASPRPVLTASLASAAEADLSWTVIIDGQIYQPQFDGETGTVTLQPEEPLSPNYHVVTFAAAAADGRATRATRIFYVQP